MEFEWQKIAFYILTTWKDMKTKKYSSFCVYLKCAAKCPKAYWKAHETSEQSSAQRSDAIDSQHENARLA